VLQDSCVGDGWPVGGVLVLEGNRLQRVDPKSFAVEDMNHLCARGGKAEAGNFSRIVAGGDCGQVVEQESEARVGPVVEFANTGQGEQGKSPLSSDSALIHGRADSRGLHSYKPSKQRIKPTATLSKSR
jgi:hypothetical protein